MALTSVLLLVLPLLYFILRHPGATMDYLPSWLRASKPRAEELTTGPPPDILVDEHDDEGGSTPKAGPRADLGEVPTFELHDEVEASAQKTTLSVPEEKPTMAPLAPPPSRPPTTASSSSSNLMAPPPRPTKPVPTSSSSSPSSSLRIPTTGPLPNRGPPPTSQQRAVGGGGGGGSRGGKILLAPGHSPMDWAALIRDPKANLSGLPPNNNGGLSLLRVKPSELKAQTGRRGKPAWTSWGGKVYNLTPYLPFHPGGEPELLRAAGRDGERLFMDVHPWVNFEGMVGGCLVGILVSEGEGVGEGAGGVEEID